ncbi:hypothetical protein RJZ56_005074 [Blastomyces dermatitidis]|uniref:Uncharacterized protein n=3 Tax=Blastomyces TaxID=229219 RepID=A0A179U8Q1_BLAGS|nr:uncharacterized protein BDBG_00946 [Blastomyces gilchristii SLH14081]XP_045275878.1 uncharacterized protein BDCG_03954 [Blastomyces dermatitidis ER-3]EEQ88834.1 hypothetical protein BDCG_03954 [Blastomyces dermatitidis ER-3]EGE81758.1 hypothetical protein BDDG_04701 [Blastomyces dermatitidis ATCC 18188]OAT04376.1 hypothetical protein BDBG_00946 [Blastomyces gilchristii SLH14081]
MFIAFNAFDIMAVNRSIAEKAAANRAQADNDALLLLGLDRQQQQLTATTTTRSTKRNRHMQKQSLRRWTSPPISPPSLSPSRSHIDTEEQYQLQSLHGWWTAIQNRFHRLSGSNGRYYALCD